MISEFEQRLANVLGGRMPAPFTGGVVVVPGPASQNQPRILVGVERIEVIEPDIGTNTHEVVPGADEPRRIVRLKCIVSLEVRQAQNEDRQQQMQGLDAALYTLDAPDFRDGTALIDSGDPGFLIHEMQVIDSTVSLDSGTENDSPTRLTLCAKGLFWPVGTAGETGIQIGEIRIRGVNLPLEISPANPRIIAGGTPVELTLKLRTDGPLRIDGEAAPMPPLPFGSLALLLLGPGGRPGAGNITGGSAGADGVRLVEITTGEVTISYIPPDEVTTDLLVVGIDNGENGLGIEIGRYPLKVQES